MVEQVQMQGENEQLRTKTSSSSHPSSTSTNNRNCKNNTSTILSSLSSSNIMSSNCDDSTPSSSATIKTTAATTMSEPSTISKARDQIFQLGFEMGNLCQKIYTCAPRSDPQLNPPYHGSSLIEQEPFWSCSENVSCCDENRSQNNVIKDSMEKGDKQQSKRDEIYDAVRGLFHALVVFCNICDIDLNIAIKKKIELNGKKYPVELCKGKSGKYTTYSSQTGITKTNQSTLDKDTTKHQTAHHKNQPQSNGYNSGTDSCSNTKLRSIPISNLTLAIREFALERNWSKYHTPRNITLAMMGEVGELAELFQWNGDVPKYNEPQNNDDKIAMMHRGLKGDGWSDQDIDKVQQEVADVAIYCLRLADVIGMKKWT